MERVRSTWMHACKLKCLCVCLCVWLFVTALTFVWNLIWKWDGAVENADCGEYTSVPLVQLISCNSFYCSQTFSQLYGNSLCRIKCKQLSPYHLVIWILSTLSLLTLWRQSLTWIQAALSIKKKQDDDTFETALSPGVRLCVCMNVCVCV